MTFGGICGKILAVKGLFLGQKRMEECQVESKLWGVILGIIVVLPGLFVLWLVVSDVIETRRWKRHQAQQIARGAIVPLIGLMNLAKDVDQAEGGDKE